MDTMWAPWRMEYILRDRSNTSECIFCEKYQQTDDQSNLVLYRGKLSYVLMNLYPYNNGHLLIAPYRHISDYTDLNDRERSEIAHLTSLSLSVLKKTVNPHGFNLGMNLGIIGGAGIADHLHQHIVPRWTGDSNFMPIIGHTKVIVQSLEETWACLRDQFTKLSLEKL
ncbi:MAG TPA: HIT domain-containing protein [Candidatus Marinimicrobia bacterium]|nr:HIT domain-containing protein [Candidatus Neomarinimicrobiota bacterium]